MIRPAFSTMKELPRAVYNHSIGLFYGQWTNRYLLYLTVFLLIGVWTFVGLEIYGRISWRITSMSFRDNYALHTMMNFGLCLYAADEWLARLTGRWGRFTNRTLGKQALVWGLSFVVAFYIQRTIVFKGIMFYDLDLYHYYEVYPQLRPRLLDHFFFCLPFLIATILFLWLVAAVRQHGLVKEQKALQSLKEKLATENEAAVESAVRPEVEPDKAQICVQSGSSQIILEQDTISHVTVEDHYCRIHTLEKDERKSFFVKSSLAELLDRLAGNHFIQIHRSHVVNARAIRQLDKKNRACRVHLKSDVVLPVSRYRLDEVLTRIKETLDLQGNQK